VLLLVIVAAAAACVILADADGCRGGVIQWAFDYVTFNDGINTEKVYPYVGKASVLTCI